MTSSAPIHHPSGTRAADRTRVDLWAFVIVLAAVSWIPLTLAGVAGREADHGLWFVVGTSGPTLAAVLLWLLGRRRSDRARLAGVFGTVRWFVVAVVFGALPTALGAAAAAGLADRPFDLTKALRQILEVGGPVPALAAFLLAGPLAEELGWRGYVQPRLRRFLSPVVTTLVLGTGWAVWHLPLYFVDGTSQAQMGLTSPRSVLYLLGFLPLTYLLWYVSERLRGGVAAALVLHLAYNASSALLRDDPLVTTALMTAICTLFAVVVYLLVERGPGARPRSHPAAPQVPAPGPGPDPTAARR